MNKIAKVSMLVTMLLALVFSVMSARADPYGFDSINSLFTSLWNSAWPIVALFFLIAIILSVFTAPLWLKKVFGMVKK